MTVSARVQPKHDVMSRATRALEAALLAAAVVLVIASGLRLANASVVSAWWFPLVALAGLLAADFASGMVHWAADTWGRESLPILGRRFLRPFRLHHANPDDILERDFFDLNGDVALLAAPLLAGGLAIPLAEEGMRVASAFLTALATFSLPTNQIHQWAHQAEPPRCVRWLQRSRLILGHEHHLRHHTAPYASHYCITTGWWNEALGRLRWFRGLEAAITRVTGLLPREDDAAFGDSRPG